MSSGNDAYTLAAVGDAVGFYKFTGSSLDPNKAHLEIPQTAEASTFYSFSDSPTAMEDVKSEGVKSEESSADGWFTLDGRRLSSQPTAKGIYVKQGKKFIVK